MPITYRIDDENKLVHAEGSGVLKSKDLRIYLDEKISASFNRYAQLFDLTAMTTEMSTKEMYDLVTLRRSLSSTMPPAPVAFAIADDNLYGMFRILQSMTETLRPIGVFRTLHEAQTWLTAIR